MFRKFVQEELGNWDQELLYLLFTIQEASMGFLLFELKYGRQP